MATSKKETLHPSRDRATRMSPNLRPSSSESSGSSHSVRRARSVPSSPDRKFCSSSPSLAGSGGFPDVQRPSLSSAGRSRTMSSSVIRAQPFSPAASKPILARAKSDKVSTTLLRPPALAVPPSSSSFKFKDIVKTAANSSPSTLLSKSQRPNADSCKIAASTKPSIQRVASAGAGRGGRVQPVSTVNSLGVGAKNRSDSSKAATTSSKAKNVPQKTTGTSSARREKEKDPSMQFDETETVKSIEEHLHEQLLHPVDLKSGDVTVPDQHGQSFHQQEKLIRNEEIKGNFFVDKEHVGGNEPNNGNKNVSGRVKTGYGSELDEKVASNGCEDKVVSLLDRTEVAQSWRKDDPKGNDVIEETKSKLLEERKSRVKALVGAFETVLSFKE